jgi:integrase
LLPHFGDYPLPAITRATIKAFIARKGQEQRWSYSKRKPNPNRPVFSQKTILNMVALLAAVLETATVDYELLSTNPLRGILRRKNFPVNLRPSDRRVRVLELEDFKRAIAELPSAIRRMALVAALAGLRWGEEVAIRVDDADLHRNRLRITRALYRGSPQTPKTEQSVRDVDMSPLVRRIVQTVPWSEGLIFSPDGVKPMGDGRWLKRQWHKAQTRAGIRQPIRWHDLRHQYVSFLILIGKSPKYVSQQAGHASAGFTLDRYGHLFNAITPTPMEWIEDLLWPGDCDQIVPIVDATRQQQTGERAFVEDVETLVNGVRQN